MKGESDELKSQGAIVNAANEACVGGGGVDDAIHRAASDTYKKVGTGRLAQFVIEATQDKPKDKRCPTGTSIITAGARLSPLRIIHTVGPNFNTSDYEISYSLLCSAYLSALNIARYNDIHYIAFPLISAGAFGASPYTSFSAIKHALIDFRQQNGSYDIDVTIYILDPTIYNKVKQEEQQYSIKYHFFNINWMD